MTMNSQVHFGKKQQAYNIYIYIYRYVRRAVAPELGEEAKCMELKAQSSGSSQFVRRHLHRMRRKQNDWGG